MTILALEKAEWRGYFDRVAKSLLGKRVEIEVASLELGDQIEAEWMPLLGVTYDPKADVLEIVLDGLEHLVPKPQRIFVDVGGRGLDSFEVIDFVGVRHIARLREPLMLPAPPTVSG
jgi:hypothetical protein